MNYQTPIYMHREKMTQGLQTVTPRLAWGKYRVFPYAVPG